MLPFLEDNELKELAAKVLASPNGIYEGVTVHDLAIFLEEEDVETLASSLLDKGEDEQASSLAPFMSDKGVNKLLQMALSKGDGRLVKKLLPFVDDDEVDELFAKAIDNGDFEKCGLSLYSLLPFVSDEVISDYFFKNVDKPNADLSKFYPFLDDRDWHRLVNEYEKGLHQDFPWDNAYHFLDDEDLKNLFKTATK
jgi:hypothetical protein